MPFDPRYARRLGPALALTLAACAPHGPRPDAAPASVEQRLMDLERRLNRLESRPPVQPPYQGKAEIQAQMRELEGERAGLLGKYTEQHPAVRDIDRQLLILQQRLKMLEP